MVLEKLMGEKIGTLRDLYVLELQDLLSAEKQIAEALPKMAKRAGHEELRKAFEEHQKTTSLQAERLETILSELGESGDGVVCEGIKGLIKENEKFLNASGPASIIDAGLIAAANRVEHYEIAAYGAAREFAEILGFDDHAALLQETLDEEGDADKLLTGLAADVNLDAYAAQ